MLSLTFSDKWAYHVLATTRCRGRGGPLLTLLGREQARRWVYLGWPDHQQRRSQQGCSDRLSSSVANLFFDNIYDHQAKATVMEALTYRTTVAGLQ